MVVFEGGSVESKEEKEGDRFTVIPLPSRVAITTQMVLQRLTSSSSSPAASVCCVYLATTIAPLGI